MRCSLGVVTSLASLSSVLAVATPKEARATEADLVLDINKIQRYWGQVHILHRHGARYPTGSEEDAVNDALFATKVAAIQSEEGTSAFTGPLSFLNTWQYYLGSGLLLPTGAAQDFTSGARFWNERGRLLYNASIGQPFYNATFNNGTARPLPLLRTTSQERILDSALAWAGGELLGRNYRQVDTDLTKGFFGPENATSKYNLLVIPEGGTEASLRLCLSFKGVSRGLC
ncbi:MAG: hypothetical protein Q9228_008037 [Teloschistes exilis]